MIQQALEQPDWICMHLVQAIVTSEQVEIRQQAAILFRRFSFYVTDPGKSFWQGCSEVTKLEAKAALLAALTVPDIPNTVRRKIGDSVAQLAHFISVG